MNYSLSIRCLTSLLIFILSGYAHVNAQNVNLLPSVATPSASSPGYAEAKYGTNHMTGALNFSVPLLTVQSNNVSVPLSLNYVAGSGVPLGMLSSEVGLGWSVQKGAYVTREVRGLPDDVYKIFYPRPGDDIIYEHVGFMYGYGSEIDQIYNTETKYMSGDFINKIEHGEVDTEPDIFHFNVEGMTGSFVIGIDHKVKLLSQAEIKIEYSVDFDFDYRDYYGIEDSELYFGSRGAITEFIITTSSGNKYILSTKGISMVNSLNERDFGYQTACFFNSEYNAKGDVGHYWRAFKEGSITSFDTWLVTSVGSINDNDEIRFEYQKEVIYNHSNVLQRTTDAKLLYYGVTGQELCFENENGFTNSLRVLNLGWRLKKIRFKKGNSFSNNGFIVFNYDSSPRDDLYYDQGEQSYPWLVSDMKAKKLKSIVWKKNGQNYRKVKFISSFLDGGYVNPSGTCSNSTEPRPWADCHDKRLILSQLEFHGLNDSSLPSYEFSYQESFQMPPRHVLATDNWGYYNGMDLTTLEDSPSVPTIYWYPEDEQQNSIDRTSFSIFQRPLYYGPEIIVNGVDKSSVSQYAQTNILTQVKYPNGAQVNFDYELNTAVYMGQKRNAGGLRVKGISSSLKPTRTFKYKDVSNKCTGVFIDIPVFAAKVRYKYQSWAGCEEPNDYSSQQLIRYSYSQNELDGRGINTMYSRIEEHIEGFGYTVMKYDPVVSYSSSASECGSGECVYIPSEIEMREGGPIDYCFYGRPGNPNYNWRRAAPIETTTYNKDGSLVKSVKYNYKTYDFEKVRGIKFMDYFSNDFSNYDNYEIWAAGKYYLLSGDQRLESTESTDYVLGTPINTITHYEYSNDHKFPIKIWFINSDGTEIATERKYIYDVAPNLTPVPIGLLAFCEDQWDMCEYGCDQGHPDPSACIDACESDYQECIEPYNTYNTEYNALSDLEKLLMDMNNNCLGGLVVEEVKKIGGTITNGSKIEFKRGFPNCEDCILPSKRYIYEDDWLLAQNVIDYNSYSRPKIIETLQNLDAELFYYDNIGKIKRKKYGNRDTEYVYNNYNELKEIKPFDNLDIVYTYDGYGRLKTKSERDGNIVETYSYEVGINENSVTIETSLSDASIPTVIRIQDLVGRTISTTYEGYSASGNDWTESTGFDQLGRRVSSCNPSQGGCTIVDYEEEKLASRIVKTTAPGWSKSIEQRSESGYLPGYPYLFHKSVLFDENGNKAEKYTDKLGRVFRVRRFDNNVPFDTDYTYDSKGRLQSVIQPGGTSFDYTYEWQNGWKRTTTIPGGGTRESRSDLKGNPVYSKDANGHEFTYVYDDYNQLLQTFKDNVLIKSATYDSKGRIDAASSSLVGANGNVVYDYEYDDNNYNRLDYVTETAFGITKRTEFNGYDHRDLNSAVSNIYSGTISGTYNHTYDYDHGARLDLVNINGHQIVDIDYDDNDWITNRKLDNELEEITYGYNSRGWLTRINELNECYDNSGPLNPNPNTVSDGNLTQNGSITIISNSNLPNGSGGYYQVFYNMTYSDTNNVIFAVNNSTVIPIGTFGTQTFNGWDTIVFNLGGEVTIGITGTTGFIINTVGGSDYNYNSPPIGITPQQWQHFIKQFNNFFIYQVPDQDACEQGNGLFAEEIHYDKELDVVDAEPQYNGNVSYVRWNALDRPVINIYGMTYDGLDRMTQAKYMDKRVWTPQGASTYVNEDAYSVYVDALDANGNILNLVRNGYVDHINDVEINHELIDNLSMSFVNNQMTDVTESGGNKGYQGAGVSGIPYDANGNRKIETEHGAQITYNYLDLPETIIDGNKTITIIYDADGIKRKMIVDWGSEDREVIYMGAAEIIDDEIQSYYHSDGRILKDGAGDELYEYMISDHLGNSRVYFIDLDGDGEISLDPADEEVTQEAHYYPYGMKMDGDWISNQDPQDKYHFNGLEFPVEDLHMGFTTYRTCDVALGGWYQVDPKAEMLYGLSPYSSMVSSPLTYNDPNGDIPPLIIGYAVVAAVGGTFNLISNAHSGMTFWDGLGYFVSGAGGTALAATGNVAAGIAFTAGFNTVLDINSGGYDNLNTTQIAIEIGGNVMEGVSAGLVGYGWYDFNKFTTLSASEIAALEAETKLTMSLKTTVQASSKKLPSNVIKGVSIEGAKNVTLKTASEAYKTSTRLGHSLSKHSFRNPERWGKLRGHSSTWHEQGMKHYDDIMNAPGKFKATPNKNGTMFLEKRLPDGRGMRLNMDATFKGLID